MAKFGDSNSLFDETIQSGNPDPEAEAEGWDRTDPDNAKIARDWKTQIELAERRNEVWEKRCERIIKRYRDEYLATSTNSGVNVDSPKRMNILWSNVQTLKPSIYGREPVPIVERRFLDRDPIGRIASQILERALRSELTESGFHDTMEQVVQDYLLVGRGVAWLRFKPLFGPASSLTDRGNDEINPAGEDYVEPNDQQPTYDPDEHDEELSDESKQEIDQKLLGATTEVDYVHWKDFLTSKARFWKENEFVARRVYMSRQDLIDAFGKVVGKEIPLEMTPEIEPGALGNRTTRAIPEEAKKGIVYEIWFKPKREVYFVAKGYEYLLEQPREDPLGLEGFWPCPRPLFATLTNDTIEPVPDYIEYQDQAMEIDNLTNRINSLISALKVAGVYDASQKQLARLLDEGYENQLIPVSNWAMFAEKGGIGNAISFLPIKEIADVLHTLFDARDKIKTDLYEITGIADIMRGQADPRETAASINTKGKWGSLRLQQRQGEVARFCRDVIKMLGEVISVHYPDSSLIEISGIMYDEGVGPETPTPPDLTGGNGPSPPLRPPMQQPQLGQPPQQGLLPPPGGQPPQQQPQIPPQLIMLQYQHALMAAQQGKMAVVNKAIALLRNDKIRGFRIDIETDSTINDNAREEKAARVEFLTSMSGFIEKAVQAVQVYPDLMPLLGKSILFTVRGFRVGRDLESSIEEFVDKTEQDLKKMAGQPKPPGPEQIKAQADIQMSQANLQVAHVKAQADQARSQAEVQSQQIQAQAEQSALQMKQKMQEVDLQIKQFEAVMKKNELEQKAHFEATQHAARMQQLEMETKSKVNDANSNIQNRMAETQAREYETKLKAHELEHSVKMKAHAQKLSMKEKDPSIEVGEPPEFKLPPQIQEHGPMPGARKAPDGNWYIPDQKRPGKYLRIDKPKTGPTEEEKLRMAEIEQRMRHAEEAHRSKLERAKEPRKVIRDGNGRIVGLH